MKLSKLDLHQLEAQLEHLLSTLWLERTKMALSVDAATLARDRRTLEDRLVLAFEDIDLEDMPLDWCWQRAAASLAEHVVEQMLLELSEDKQNHLH